MSYERLRPTFTFNAERLNQLRMIVPEAFADGAINWDVLRATLGDHIEDEGAEVEHFGLFWPGKRSSRQRASEPSRGTLVSVAGEGVDEASTRNVFIEADNLDALKLLQKAYAGRVKLVYIDPPYNTGNDFVYRDDFRETEESYLKRTQQMNEIGKFLTTNPKVGGRFHSNWLNMMYPRLLLAQRLLTEDGVIVVSIDDTEVHHLRIVLNEVFGEENFIGQLIWKSRQFPDARSTTQVSTDHEYLVVYTNRSIFSFKGVERDESKFANPDNDARGPWMSRSILGLATAEQRPNLHFEIVDPSTGISYAPPSDTGWRYSRERMRQLITEGKILFPARDGGRPREKKFRSEMQNEFISFPSIIDDVYTAHGTAEIRELFGFQAFDFPKPSELMRRLIEQTTGQDDLIFDLFAGSGTTAQAVYTQNLRDSAQRQYVCIQLAETVAPDSELARRGYSNIAQVSKDRIRRYLANQAQQAQNELPLDSDQTDRGFRVFRLANSHFRHWEDYDGTDIATLEQQFQMFETPLIDGWEPAHLLIEVMLQLGFPLDSRIETQSAFTANVVQRITSDFHAYNLYACFDSTIADETIAALTLGAEDIFVCLDSALTDQSKARLSDVCNLRTI